MSLPLLQIVKEKDRFRKAPPNYAMKKTQLLKDKVMLDVSGCVQEVFTTVSLSFITHCHFWGVKAMAEESGDGDRVKVIQDELNELEERAEALDRQRTKNISAIRYLHCPLTYHPGLSEHDT